MRRSLERRWRCVALLLFTLATPVTVAAVDVRALKPEGYVSDFARVIDAASRSQLEQYALRVERMTGAQMAFVTLDTLDNEPVEDVANNLYRAWGIGQKQGESRDAGVLVLLAVKDHRSRIEVGRGLEGTITDGTAGGILREMRPALRQGQFGEAMLLAAAALGEKIAAAKGVNLSDYAPRVQRRPPPNQVSIPWPLLLGGFLLLMWMMGMAGSRGSRRRRGGGMGGMLPGILIGDMLSRGPYGGGGYGRGGFGGYDSGDTFGGFGGGDSGGGGASSSW